MPWSQIAETGSQALTLEVDIGWPMSADYMTLAHQVLPLQDRVDALHGEVHVLNDRVSALTGHAEHLSNALESSENSRKSFQSESAQFQRNATRLEHELVKVQGEFKDLAEHLKNIENSTVFKATRPLVKAKIVLDQLRGRKPKHETLKPNPFLHSMQPRFPMEPTSHPVDVIVPVYRGLADTRLCVESVLAAPVQVPYRLIVINDCSPEPEVTQWLRERAAGEPRIMLLENEENLGFVGTVNRGMALSQDNDVLLLNSDTEVANDWLDRIRNAAYGDRKIASVTPFSTNATICSYPRFCEDNPLPPGYDTARMDALCAATNPGAVVDVPTGVGFCMYIRRDSLKEVGLFDTKNFGKGYGEENDFCQRAIRSGWRNVHLLDTFVLHTGGVSFGDSKSPRERAAMDKLARLHPHYASDVHKFVQADPARPYRLALDVARIRDANLPVIATVLHDRAGGTVRHVRELAEYLEGKAVFLILTPSANKSVSLRMASAAEGFELAFKIEDQFEDLLNVLRQLHVSHVHYHHLLGHDRHVRDIPALLNVTYDFTAHDFYSYCTYITLTGEENRYQGEHAPGQCKCCTPDMPAPMEGNVARWRGANARFLSAARHVITPSHDTARRILGFAPAAHVHAVAHTDIDPAVPLPVPAPPGDCRRSPAAHRGAGCAQRHQGRRCARGSGHGSHAPWRAHRVPSAGLWLPPSAEPAQGGPQRAWRLQGRRASQAARLAQAGPGLVPRAMAGDLQLHAECRAAGRPAAGRAGHWRVRRACRRPPLELDQRLGSRCQVVGELLHAAAQRAFRAGRRAYHRSLAARRARCADARAMELPRRLLCRHVGAIAAGRRRARTRP